MFHKPLKTVFLGFGAAMATSVSFALIQPQLDTAEPSLIDVIETLPTTQIQAEIPPAEHLVDHLIEQGQSLSEIFSQQGLDQATLALLMTQPEGRALNRISAGKTLHFTISPDGKLLSLRYPQSAFETLTATRIGDGFRFKLDRTPVTYREQSARATIDHSLFADGQRAGVPAKVLAQLADIFAYDIDFAHEIKPGDSFALVYNERLADDSVIGADRVLAAEFNANGKTYQAVYYTNDKGRGAYYRPDGRGLRKAFLRSPVEYARISSHFNPHRKHPVLNKIRAHKGVDYAAPTGTPIKTTADGKIAFQGWKSGYGRCVIVEHGRGYSTLYGHLSRFHRNLKVGKSVAQGQVIGYIGQSGLATGPHLHYEFRVNGVHKNPLTVALPNSPAIDKANLQAFYLQTQPYLAQLEQLKPVQVAQN